MFSTLWIPISNPYTMYLYNLLIYRRNRQREIHQERMKLEFKYMSLLYPLHHFVCLTIKRVLIMNFRFLNSLHSYLRCDRLCLILMYLHCHVPFDLHVDMNINLNVH